MKGPESTYLLLTGVPILQLEPRILTSAFGTLAFSQATEITADLVLSAQNSPAAR